MYVVVRALSYKPGHELTAEERDESEALMVGVPGFHGNLTVDIGGGKYIRVSIWESKEAWATPTDAAEGARIYMEKYAARIVAPVIGQGEVVSNTLL